MTPLGQCTVTCEASMCIARFTGEIDASNAGALEDYILRQVPSDATCVVLDLSSIRYLDSSGIRLLFSLDERCRSRQQRCSIAIPSDHLVRRVLQVVRVESIIPVCDSVEAAAAAAREAI